MVCAEMMHWIASCFESVVTAGGHSWANLPIVVMMQQHMAQQNQMQQFQAMQIQMQQFQHMIMNQVDAMEHCAMKSDWAAKKLLKSRKKTHEKQDIEEMWRARVEMLALWVVEKIILLTELYTDKLT